MQQIMEMASAMGLEIPAEEGNIMQLVPQEVVQQVSHALHQAEAKEKRQETLVRALLPYLSPKRQVRLERAMKISHLSRMAGVAFQGNFKSHPMTEQEEMHV